MSITNIKQGIHQTVAICFNAGMNNKIENRRIRLRRLIAETRLVELAKRSGKPARWLSDIAAGRKPFGEKVADSITDGLGFPRGWFDEPADQTDTSGEPQTSAGQPDQAVARGFKYSRATAQQKFTV